MFSVLSQATRDTIFQILRNCHRENKMQTMKILNFKITTFSYFFCETCKVFFLSYFTVKFENYVLNTQIFSWLFLM